MSSCADQRLQKNILLIVSKCKQILKKARKLVFESTKNKKGRCKGYIYITCRFKDTRLESTFPEFVKKMIKKHKNYKRKFDNSAFVICSFDGAIHGDLNVVLFNTEMLSHTMNKK